MGIPQGYFTKLMQGLNVKRQSGGISIDIDYTKLGIKLDLAQDGLDAAVWASFMRYMPFDEGTLRSNTNALNVATRGEVYKYDPNVEYGHYVYEGEKYVDPITGAGAFYSPEYGFWSRPKTEKVPSGQPLQYTQPGARDHWDVAAINSDAAAWLEVVKRALT